MHPILPYSFNPYTTPTLHRHCVIASTKAKILPTDWFVLIRQFPSLTAAGIVANKPKYSHIMTYMRETRHYLTVAERIAFKNIMLTRDSIVGTALSTIETPRSCVSQSSGLSIVVLCSRADMQVLSSRLCLLIISPPS